MAASDEEAHADAALLLEGERDGTLLLQERSILRIRRVIGKSPELTRTVRTPITSIQLIYAGKRIVPIINLRVVRSVHIRERVHADAFPPIPEVARIEIEER